MVTITMELWNTVTRRGHSSQSPESDDGQFLQQKKNGEVIEAIEFGIIFKAKADFCSPGVRDLKQKKKNNKAVEKL